MDRLIDWQPIETAPRDRDHAVGSWWIKSCLVFVPDQFGGVILVAQMDADEWIYGPDEHRAYAALTEQPTHWQPLPEPPCAARSQSTPDILRSDD